MIELAFLKVFVFTGQAHEKSVLFDTISIFYRKGLSLIQMSPMGVMMYYWCLLAFKILLI